MAAPPTNCAMAFAEDLLARGCGGLVLLCRDRCAGLRPNGERPPEQARDQGQGQDPHVVSPFHSARPEARVIAGKLAAAVVVADRTPHLVDRRIESVHGREDEGLDRQRFDRRSQRPLAVVGSDEMQDFRAQRLGKAGDGATGLVHHDRPEGDVPDHVAVARVGRRGVVLQFLQLADVVQDGAGDHQVRVGAVEHGEHAAGLGHREDVLEEPAAIRVMDHTRRRPEPQRRFVLLDDPREQRLQVRCCRRRPRPAAVRATSRRWDAAPTAPGRLRESRRGGPASRDRPSRGECSRRGTGGVRCRYWRGPAP